MKVKVTQIGSSVGIVLPKEVLARLKVGKGDSVYLVESAEGYSINAYDPDFDEEIRIGREYARKYRNALRELAK